MNRLPAALHRLANRLDLLLIADLGEDFSMDIARVCRALADHPERDSERVRDASRDVLGMLHAAILTNADDPILVEDAVALVENAEWLLASVSSGDAPIPSGS